MCDAPEAPFFVRALRRVGCAVEAADELPLVGFPGLRPRPRGRADARPGRAGHPRACWRRLGLTQRFAMLTQQPAWVSGSLPRTGAPVRRCGVGPQGADGGRHGRGPRPGRPAGSRWPACSTPWPGPGPTLAELRRRDVPTPERSRPQRSPAHSTTRRIEAERQRRWSHDHRSRHPPPLSTRSAALRRRPAPAQPRLAAAPLVLAALSIPVTGAGSALGATHAPAHVKVAAVADAVVGVVATGKHDV